MKATEQTFSRALPRAVVPAGGVIIVHSAQVSSRGPLRPVSLGIPKQVAENLLIADIKVGKNSQLVSVGALPADVFARGKRAWRLDMDTLEPGMHLTLGLVNTGNTAVPFEGEVALANPGEERVRNPMAMLGFGHTTVEANGTANISVQSQVPFEPAALHVPENQLDIFEILSLQHGPYLDVDELSKAAASSLSKENLLGNGLIALEPLSRLSPGDCLTLSVKNLTDKPAFFSAAIRGFIVS